LNTNAKETSGAAGKHRALAWGAVLTVLLLLLVPVGGPTANPWSACFWNLLHLPAFYALTRSLRTLSGGVAGAPRGFFLPALLAILFAAGSELVQSAIGRSASFHDFTLDAFGIALGLLSPVRPLGGSLLQRAGSGLLLVCGVAFAFSPAFRAEQAERKAKEKLPVLGDFEDLDCRRLWKAQGPCTATWDPAKGGLRVAWRPGAFGGVQFLPGEQDWSPYSELRLKVSNPGPPVPLGIRIDDPLSAKDRVWRSAEATIGEGDSEIIIPLREGPARRGSREMDLSRTTRLVLFIETVENPVEFFIISAGLR
jgi:hypothetical protein